MTDEKHAVVLLVDDDPDGQRSLISELPGTEVRIRHPQDIESVDLRAADLVLLDYRLEEWPDRDAATAIALAPPDGLALSGVLRSRALRDSTDRPTAFALRTSFLKDLAGGLPPEVREHIVARANNLEWAFEKADAAGAPPTSERIQLLARSVADLPESWPHDDADAVSAMAAALLGLGDAAWSDRAWGDVEQCHPPLHELYEASHGLAFLRWLLHRILSYPCFLLDEHHLAARLRISPQSVRAGLDDDSLNLLLKEAAYQGTLAGFSGRRWWRAGVDALLFQWTDGAPFDSDRLRAVLQERLGREVDAVSFAQPVVCLDTQYRPLDQLYSLDDVVRIQPDDWPPYADQAYAAIETARGEPSVRSIVATVDRELL